MNQQNKYMKVSKIILTFAIIMAIALSSCNNDSSETKKGVFCSDEEVEQYIQNNINEPVKITGIKQVSDNEREYTVKLIDRDNVEINIKDVAEISVNSGSNVYTNTLNMNYCEDIVNCCRAKRLQLTREYNLYVEYTDDDRYRVKLRNKSEIPLLAEYYYKLQDIYKFNCKDTGNNGAYYAELVEIHNENPNELGKEQLGDNKDAFIMLVNPFSISGEHKEVKDIENELYKQYDTFKNDTEEYT